jgi:hypothetical protein
MSDNNSFWVPTHYTNDIGKGLIKRVEMTITGNNRVTSLAVMCYCGKNRMCRL